MKQAVFKKGIVFPLDVPEPTVKNGFVKIRVHYSCISAGTEVNGVKGSRRNILKRAIDTPEKIKSTIDYLFINGINKTFKKLETITESYKSSGYSVSGIVTEIGIGVNSIRIGDRVVGSGAGFAVHAEYVTVPFNLIARIPDYVSLEEATVATVGAIALHGVRRADLKLGEYAAVIGCGLIGLLTTQILRNSGIRVACIDLDSCRLELALRNGAEITVNPNNENVVSIMTNWTEGFGVDAVIFSASTNSSEPLHQAFQMTRKKGKVVMVGVSGMTINREEMYKKEIDFLISTSYGPGRYDDKYELEGFDYPYHYVRWTEGRNIKEFLRLLRDKNIDLNRIGVHKYSINSVGDAFRALEARTKDVIIAILEYPTKSINEGTKSIRIEKKLTKSKKGVIKVGLIGAGSFAINRHLPIIESLPKKYSIKTIVNRNGKQAWEVAKNFNADFASTEVNDIFMDDEIDLVLICTRHDSHADLVIKSLNANKNVFVEKPLATTLEQLKEIETIFEKKLTTPILMVGFNRRFSKFITEIKKHTDKRISPLFIRYRMNAGFSPADSWVHKDGGRIVGEACHIIDLMHYLTNSKVKEYSVNSLFPNNTKYISGDNKSITLSFEDGSITTIDYFAVGNSNYPKEFMEVHFDNKSIELNDYKSIYSFGVKTKSIKTKTSNKGHLEEWIELYDSLTNENYNSPISVDSIFETTRLSILAAKSS